MQVWISSDPLIYFHVNFYNSKSDKIRWRYMSLSWEPPDSSSAFQPVGQCFLYSLKQCFQNTHAKSYIQLKHYIMTIVIIVTGNNHDLIHYVSMSCRYFRVWIGQQTDTYMNSLDLILDIIFRVVFSHYTKCFKPFSNQEKSYILIKLRSVSYCLL